jgi:hypothetical protein
VSGETRSLVSDTIGHNGCFSHQLRIGIGTNEPAMAKIVALNPKPA